MKAVPALLALALAGCRSVGDPEAHQAQAPSFRVLLDQAVEEPYETAAEVRWAGEDSVVLLLPWTGLMPVSIDLSANALEAGPPTPPDGPSPGRQLWLQHLAAWGDYRAVAERAFLVEWWQLSGASRGEHLLEYPGDLDLQGDRLLLVGGRRGDDGEFGSDGTIAWIGHLSRNLDDLRPVLPSQDGPGLRRLVDCAGLDQSAARFLPDGSFVVVPGFEPGVYLYSPDGLLARTWDTETLGIDADCPVGGRESQVMGTDPDLRATWTNRLRVVEEVLALGEGPALVVREWDGERARWDLLFLGDEPRAERLRLPFESATPDVRLHADSRDDRIVFLLQPLSAPRQDERHRLIVGEMAGR